MFECTVYRNSREAKVKICGITLIASIKTNFVIGEPAV
jgi:hypothetical protein